MRPCRSEAAPGTVQTARSARAVFTFGPGYARITRVLFQTRAKPSHEGSSQPGRVSQAKRRGLALEQEPVVCWNFTDSA